MYFWLRYASDSEGLDTVHVRFRYDLDRYRSV